MDGLKENTRAMLDGFPLLMYRDRTLYQPTRYWNNINVMPTFGLLIR